MIRIGVARAALVCTAFAAAFAVAGFGVQSHETRVASAQEGSGQCGALRLAAAMPNNVLFNGAVDPQGSVDCFAWQEFFYLNWRAQPGAVGLPDPSAAPAAFGTPAKSASQMTTTVWESYHPSSDVFPDAAFRGISERPKAGHEVLAATSKFLGDAVDLHGIQQATTGWLTDQKRKLTFYEVRVDNDEYQYVTSNHLGTIAGQQACVNSKYGLQLPAGGGTSGKTPDYDCAGTAKVYGQNFGAIELKAAWIELPDQKLWSKYLTALADIYVPGLPPRKNVVVGLVGLHIIHKVPNQQQLNWATFEHVDNDPDASATPNPSATWTYNNPNCNPSTDHYKCVPNAQPSTPCLMAKGARASCDPFFAPIQVTRLTPIDSNASPVNAKAWALIQKANPASVFLHYELVQVQWPTSGTTVVPPQSRVPLPDGNPLPRTPVANTTMETYIQNKTCFYCHQYAPIASRKLLRASNGGTILSIPANPGLTAHVKAKADASFGSDYSFLFQKAR
jgi:hypothetical protein